ncbi:hypothetical protein FRB93_013559 [Tulasnella sp. JGI-2019a]|nr:hypothetical protein FRB93_013559 [Tulasnella sp. JGI-2019a]
MFRFGKKKTEQKQKKKAAPAEPTLKVVEPTKILFEEASPLAKAKAAADKKICHVAEKGLPSFEEFGAKPLEMEVEEVGEPETIKVTSSVAHEEVLRPGGNKTVGRRQPARSPSPQPPPVNLNSPIRHPLVDVRYSPQPVAQPYESEFADFGYPPGDRSVHPPADLYGQPPPVDPRYAHDPYRPSTVRPPNPSSDYRTQRHSRAEPYYPPQQSYSMDQYYDAPRLTPAPHHEPPREPVYPPPHHYDTRPQYPSPQPERYAPPVADRFSGAYGGQVPYYSEYDQPEWRPEPTNYPLSRQPRHSTTWDPPPNHQPYPAQQAPPQHYPTQYDHMAPWPSHDPHHHVVPYPSNDPYRQAGHQPQHQRARTMDAEIPYRDSWAPPSPYRPPPTTQVPPPHTSQRQMDLAPGWQGQPVRRRSYSLQPQQQRAPPPPPQPDPVQEQIRRRRSQRYSDYTGQARPYQSPPQESRWPEPSPVQSPPPHRQSVASITHQLTDMYIEPPSTPVSRPPSQSFSPAREQTSPAVPLRDPEHFSALYKAPPASRSSSSFDFSSPSSSPSPASRKRLSSATTNESHFDLRHSSSHTSLHSVPEAEQEEEEAPLQKEEELPTLAQFRRKRVAPPVWQDTSQKETRSEREDYGQQAATKWKAPERTSDAVQRQRTQYRPQPPSETAEREVQKAVKETVVHRQRTQYRPQPPTPQQAIPAESGAYDMAQRQRTQSRPQPPTPQAGISADLGAHDAAQRQRTQSRPQPPSTPETLERNAQDRTSEMMVHRQRTQYRPQPQAPQQTTSVESGAYDSTERQRTPSRPRGSMPQADMPVDSGMTERQRTQSRPQPPSLPETPERSVQDRTSETMVHRQRTQYRPQPPTPQQVMSTDSNAHDSAQRQRTQSRPQPPPTPETPERNVQDRTSEKMVHRQRTQYRPQPPTPQQAMSTESGAHDSAKRQRTKSRPQPPPLPDTTEREVQERTNEAMVHRQRTQSRPQPPTPQQPTAADHVAYDAIQQQRTKSRPRPPPPEADSPAGDVPHEVPTVDDGDDYGYTKDEYYDSTVHNSPATNRVTSSPLKDGRSSSVPNTPNRQRTVAVRGPRAPKSPPNASTYGNI